jgi:hypothetical protein
MTLRHRDSKSRERLFRVVTEFAQVAVNAALDARQMPGRAVEVAYGR